MMLDPQTPKANRKNPRLRFIQNSLTLGERLEISYEREREREREIMDEIMREKQYIGFDPTSVFIGSI